jgi:hypothetical protein
MRISFDIHGVLNKYTNYLRSHIKELKNSGDTIIICTGSPQNTAIDELKELNIHYDELISVVDFHKRIGTPMWQSERGSWYCSQTTWNKTKGILCAMYKVDLHVDDSKIYNDYFRTPYMYIDDYLYSLQEIDGKYTCDEYWFKNVYLSSIC